MIVQKLLTIKDRAHLHNVLSVFGAGRHPHEHLVRVFHRRICDPQMPLADRVVVGFNDVVCRRMQRWRHVAQLVKHRQVIQRRIATHVIKVTQERRAGHRHEHRMRPPKADIVFRIAGVIGEVAGNGGD